MVGGPGIPPSAGAEQATEVSAAAARRSENRLVMFIASLPFVLEPRACCVIAFGKEVTRGRKRLHPVRVLMTFAGGRLDGESIVS